MEQSLSPLFALLIATLILLALGVHAVSAGDPEYGLQLLPLPPALEASKH
jgi:hypothetical protein